MTISAPLPMSLCSRAFKKNRYVARSVTVNSPNQR